MKETNICNLTDHTTLYACWKNLDSISKKLETETNETMKCFKNNEMVANPSKFQLKFLSKYKSLEKNITLLGMLSNHQIESNYLVLHWVEILILDGT